MKKIKIFVAGSTELKEERNCIKLIANDLNSVYRSSNVFIVSHTYEHFNDNQEEYNSFIESEADIVIFVLDGYIGSETEKEFLKAIESNKKTNRPEIMLFVHGSSELSPDIKYIQGLIKASMGSKYYVDYSDIEDLESKAKERILRYIDNHKQDTMIDDSSVSRGKGTVCGGRSTRNWIFRNRTFFLLCIIALLTGTLIWRLFYVPELLIFAGGGSVKNYIEQTRGVDILDYPHSIYANLASGSAWALLTEDATRFQEDRGRSQEQFSSICLSADDIDSTFTNEKNKGIYENARIVRYKLGNDPLVVYVYNGILSEVHISKDMSSICIDSLKSLVKYALITTNDVRLFTTSKTSGTLRLYQSCFESCDSVDFERLLDTKRSFLFYKQSNEAYINALDDANGGNKPYIILGSEYYYPLCLNNSKIKQYHKLYIKRGDDNVCKPMNVYFVGKYDAKNPEFCTVSKSVVRFLSDINAENDVDKDVWEELIHGKVKTEGVKLILSIN